MLSLALKRYYKPLRLPIRPAAISFPYTRRLMFLNITASGLQHWTWISSATCRPCYPGRLHQAASVLLACDIGLPHLSTGSASPLGLTRLHTGSLALRPAALPIGNLRPPVARTPLPCATGVYGQLPGRNFNPLDIKLLLRTDRIQNSKAGYLLQTMQSAPVVEDGLYFWIFSVETGELFMLREPLQFGVFSHSTP